MAVSAKTRKAQYGRESVKGTAVAATGIWRGLAVLSDKLVLERQEEQTGIMGGYGRVETTSKLAQIDMASQAATYEQFPHILEAGFQTVAASGSGTTYTYTYNVPVTGQPTVKTYTWEYGDAVDAEEAEYCFVESFSLSGAPNETVKLSAVWKGRQVTATTFTGSLSLVSVSSILFNTGTLFIDDSGGSVGSTQVSNSFRSFSLSVDTGRRAIWTGEGNLYFSFDKVTDPTVELNITAEHDTNWDSDSEKANWRAGTVRLIRIRFTGSGSRQLTIDLAGKWENFTAIEEEEGNSVMRGSFFGHYSADDSLFGQFVVRNALASLS